VENFLEGAFRGKEAQVRDVVKEHVYKDWHNGVLSHGPRSTITDTIKGLNDIRHNRREEIPLTTQQEEITRLAKAAYARLALSDLTSTDNPLDLTCLLRDPGDFLTVGSTKNVGEGLMMVGREIVRINAGKPSVEEELVVIDQDNKNVDVKEEEEKPDARDIQVEDPSNTSPSDPDRDDQTEEPHIEEDAILLPSKRKRQSRTSTSLAKKPKLQNHHQPPKTPTALSSPLSQAPESPKPSPSSGFGIDREEALRAMRLELISLSKFYPLAALKKMSVEEAGRLLPPNVRGLMTVQDGVKGAIQGGGK
jgi:bromodomain-containing protein 7/9